MIFHGKLKKLMGPACRAGPELPENGRNNDFRKIFDQFMKDVIIFRAELIPCPPED